MKTVFFSWQSDSLPPINRDLITTSIKEALDQLDLGLTYDEATEKVRGSPNILEILQEKIALSSIFIADLTIVGKYKKDRATPNPNVLTEYGIAVGSIGPERILGVMNTNSSSPRDLPFDLDKKYVAVRYELSDKASADNIEAVRIKLVEEISKQLYEIWKHVVFDGLSSLATRVVEHLVTSAEDADGYDRIPTNTVCSALNIGEDEFHAVKDQLEAKCWIKHDDPPGRDDLIPLSPLFWKFDEIYMDWKTTDDAALIAELLVSGERPRENQKRVPDIASKFGWHPRRINPAITYLVDNEIVEDAGYDNPFGYVFFAIRETAQTRMFAKNQPR